MSQIQLQQFGERQRSFRSDDHSILNTASAPQKPKTRMCKFHLEGTCRRGSGCSYAHGESELQGLGNGRQQNPRDRDTHQKTKTRMCKFYLEGTCRRGSGCSYAHGEEDLQGSGHGQQQEIRDWDTLGRHRQMQQPTNHGDTSGQQHANLPAAAWGFPAAERVADGHNSFERPTHTLPSHSEVQSFVSSAPTTQPWQQQQHQQQQQFPSSSSIDQQFQMQPFQNMFLVNQQSNTQLPQQFEQHPGPQQLPQPWIQNLQQFPTPMAVGPGGMMAACFFVPMQASMDAPVNGVHPLVQQTSIQPEPARELQTTNLAENSSLDAQNNFPFPSFVPQRPLPLTQQTQVEQQMARPPRNRGDNDFRPTRPEHGRRTAQAQLDREERRSRLLELMSARRRTAPRELDSEERDSLLLQLLSVAPFLEPPQATDLLEAADWNLHDALVVAVRGSARARRQGRDDYDADVQEAIRRSMIDEHYSGGFAAEGLSQKEIADSTSTMIYCHASSDEEVKDECAICLAMFKDGDELRVLGCQHSFHKSCIDDWLSQSGQCAVCRQSVAAGSSLK